MQDYESEIGVTTSQWQACQCIINVDIIIKVSIQASKSVLVIFSIFLKKKEKGKEIINLERMEQNRTPPP